ncbi:MAG: NAD(P)H-dependent glycerol-3-phosphate dehydrogenase [Bdellovibrionota bacterium]
MKIEKKSRVLIVGAGAYGTALEACVLTNQNRSVSLLNRQGCAEFSENIAQFDFILIAVPSASLREIALWIKQRIKKNEFPKKKINIISTAKGIEKNSTLLPHQILQEVLQEIQEHISIGVLSGPSFAKEMMQGLPTCVVLASKDAKLLKTVSPLLHSSYFRIYDSNDILGVEVAGALKNIIAMVAGAVDGLSLGNNARAAVMTRGLAEMAEIGVKMGANPLTFMGLSGLGDLILTCTGDLSRNRQFGYRLAKGEDKNSILQSLGGVVEGIATTQSAYKLTQKLNIKTTILMTAYLVLYQNLPIVQAVKSLLGGEQSTEFNWLDTNKE